MIEGGVTRGSTDWSAACRETEVDHKRRNPFSLMSKGERSSKTKLRRKQFFYQIEKNISDRGSKGMN